MARRSDHAAFQLFFKKCWRNTFWSLVVISCKSVRNTPPPPTWDLLHLKARSRTLNITYFFNILSFYHAGSSKKQSPARTKKKKKKGGVILLTRVNCYQTVSHWCFSFYPLLTSIHPIVRDAGQSGSVWGVSSSKYTDISFQDETVTSWTRLFAENSGAVVHIWPWGRREEGGVDIC